MSFCFCRLECPALIRAGERERRGVLARTALFVGFGAHHQAHDAAVGDVLVGDVVLVERFAVERGRLDVDVLLRVAVGFDDEFPASSSVMVALRNTGLPSTYWSVPGQTL